MNIIYITHRGAVRPENQDALCVAETVRLGDDMSAPETLTLAKEYPILLAVIDGMGGYQGGARAAQILAATLAEGARNRRFSSACVPEMDKNIILSMLETAAERMRSEALNDPELSSMGATVSGVLLRDKEALAFNCGDCRTYRFSGEELERLTCDHSIVQELFEKGEIDEDEMRLHPRKNIVTSKGCTQYGAAYTLECKLFMQVELFPGTTVDSSP
jgi:protein phosphatase